MIQLRPHYLLSRLRQQCASRTFSGASILYAVTERHRMTVQAGQFRMPQTDDANPRDPGPVSFV